jgi:ribosome modulation factor
MVATLKMPLPEDGQTVRPALNENSNGPDRDEFLFLMGQNDKADEDVKVANAQKKKIRQHIMNRGVDLEMADQARKERDKKDNTTVLKLQKFAQYAKFFGLPVGSHIKLFDGPASAAEAVAAENTLLEKAYDEGRELGIRGKSPDEQKWLPTTPEGQEHLRGWNDGQDVLKQKLLAMNSEIADGEASKASQLAQKEKAKADKAAAKAAKEVRTIETKETEVAE